MKIIAPTVGSVTEQKTVGYVINIAKILNAQLVFLRVLTEKKTEAAGEQILSVFIERGRINDDGHSQ